VLFDEEGLGAEPNYGVAVRDMSGSPPIPLGEGVAGRLSPDGKWAATIVGYSRLLLLPIGAGAAQGDRKGRHSAVLAWARLDNVATKMRMC
jgi:hypothetical protein